MDSSSQTPLEPSPDFLEQRFRLLIDGLQDYAVFMIDLSATITSWNVGVERVLGYRAEEFVGLPFAALFTPEDVTQGQPAQELARAAAVGRSDDKREHVRQGWQSLSRRWRGRGHPRRPRPAAGLLKGYA